MKFYFSPGISTVLLSSLALCGWEIRGFAAEAPLSAKDVLQKAVTRAQQAEANSGQKGYSYTKISVTEEFDSSGRVKERKEKVYRVYFKGGTTFLRLVSINGRPPGPEEIKQQSENEMNVRQILGSSKGSKAGDNRENFLTPELVARFDFILRGQSRINDRLAYQIAFSPKYPEPPVHRIVDRLLNRISGTIWIDAEEFEIAHAEVHLGAEVELLGGVVGCLKKLAYTLTRTRVGEGLWLNTDSSGDFEGRKLLDSKRIKMKSQSKDFRLLQAAS